MWTLALVPLAAALTFDDLPACERAPLARGENEFYAVAVSAAPMPDAIGGHIALWQRSEPRDRDHFWQYGMVRGTNLQLAGIVLGWVPTWWTLDPVDKEIRKYKRQGRAMVALKLNLPSRERILLQNALTQAKKTDERTAPWDWVDNNCSTAIRDVLDEALEGRLAEALDVPAGNTLRDDVLRHAGVLPWAWAGLALAGAPVDRDHGAWTHAAFSLRLANDLDQLTLDGEPLVTERCLLLDGDRTLPPAQPPDFTGALAGLGLAWGGLLVGASLLPGRGGRVATGVGVATTSALLTVAGVVLWGLAGWSTWRGWSPNALLAMLQPGWVIGVWAGALVARGSQPKWLRTTGGMAALSVVAAALAGVSLGQRMGPGLALFGPPLLALGAVLWRGQPQNSKPSPSSAPTSPA